MCIIHGSDTDVLSYAHTNCMDEPVAACVSSMSGLEIYRVLNVTQSTARTQTDSYAEANKNPTNNHHSSQTRPLSAHLSLLDQI